MKASHYQTAVERTMAPPAALAPAAAALANYALGLAGEAGEAAELVKKALFHGHELDRERLVKELGDVAFYLAAIASTLKVDLADILVANIEKRLERYPNGFTPEDSRARRDEA